MNTATRVQVLDWDTDAALYRLTPPLAVGDDAYDHLVISALLPVNGDKGCIALPATQDGEVTSWHPLAANDSPDHADLLRQLGYEVPA